MQAAIFIRRQNNENQQLREQLNDANAEIQGYRHNVNVLRAAMNEVRGEVINLKEKFCKILLIFILF